MVLKIFVNVAYKNVYIEFLDTEMVEMRGQRLVVLGMMTLFLLPLLTVLSADASDQLEKPEWHEGDYWEYDVSMFGEDVSVSGHKHVEVEQAKTIMIGGQEYHARMVTIHDNITGQYFGSTYSFECDTIKYYNEEDMSLMKYISDSSATGHTENVYSFPFVGMNYPVYVGKEWERHATRTITNSSGSKTDYVDFHYKCTGKTDVNTKAGLFSCYVIKSWEEGDGEGNYSLSYLSSDVGYPSVMQEEYEEGEKTHQEKLTSFRYSRPPTANFIYTPSSPVKSKQTINFVDNSTDPDNNIINWTWNFGDGVIVYGKNVNHTYSKDGTYNVTLTVTDEDGASDDYTITITVEKEKGIPGFEFTVLIMAIAGLMAFGKRRDKERCG